MVKIYCLIDPRTNAPFYIGITSVTLRARLNAHIAEAAVWAPGFRGIKAKKQKFIRSLTDNGLRPGIKCIILVNKAKASAAEAQFYSYFTGLGFQLLQAPHRFVYPGDKAARKIA